MNAPKTFNFWPALQEYANTKNLQKLAKVFANLSFCKLLQVLLHLIVFHFTFTCASGHIISRVELKLIYGASLSFA